MNPTELADLKKKRDAAIQKGQWAQTWSGVACTPQHLHPDDVKLIDIAHQLAGINRYNGATDRTWSVAAHSLACAEFCRLRGESPLVQFAALIHDAHEIYVGDLIQPMKMVPEVGAVWRPIEEAAERAVHHALGLTAFIEAEAKRTDAPETEEYARFVAHQVKRADLEILAAEHAQFHSAPEPFPWRIPVVTATGATALKIAIGMVGHYGQYAEREFLGAFAVLRRKTEEQVKAP